MGKFVRKDGRLISFISSKSFSLYTQKIKAQKLTWTQAWRRRNKKGKTEGVQKRRTKRATKTLKAITGLSIEQIRNRRHQQPEVRKAQREQALREIKERRRKAKEAKKAKNKNRPKTAGVQHGKGYFKTPKSRQKMNRGALR